MNLPTFLLEPENILHKIGEIFGGGDIDFPESPVFSSKYLLKGSDLERITSLIGPEVRLGPVRGIPQLVHIREQIAEMFGG